MSWFSNLFHEDSKTFEQDLELLVARWTNRARKDGTWMTIKQVGERLLEKAEELLEQDLHAKRKKK